VDQRRADRGREAAPGVAGVQPDGRLTPFRRGQGRRHAAAPGCFGPHTIASFTTEYRAFLFNIWATFEWVAPPGIDDPWIYQDPGWGDEFRFDEEDAMIDPRKRDGLYVGAVARAHRRRQGQ